MTKYLSINTTIEQQVFDSLVSFYNEMSTCDTAVIYFSTRGGDTSVAEAIIDIINHNRKTTTVIGFGNLYSCGFQIFFELKCSKRLLDSANGMYHLSYITVDMNERWKTASWDKEKEEFMLYHQRKNTSLFLDNLGLTESEFKNIMNGKDVYFLPCRMKEILNFKNKTK